MRDLDLILIANALADVGIRTSLNECKDPSVTGICESIKHLAEQRDSAKSNAIISCREAEKEKWLRQCAEQDVARMKRLLEEK